MLWISFFVSFGVGFLNLMRSAYMSGYAYSSADPIHYRKFLVCVFYTIICIIICIISCLWLRKIRLRVKKEEEETIFQIKSLKENSEIDEYIMCYVVEDGTYRRIKIDADDVIILDS